MLAIRKKNNSEFGRALQPSSSSLYNHHHNHHYYHYNYYYYYYFYHLNYYPDHHYTVGQQQYQNLRFKLGIAIRRKRRAVRIIINAVKEYKERRKAVSVSNNDDNAI